VALERGSKILEEDVSTKSGTLFCQLGAIDEACDALGQALSLATAAQAPRRVARIHWELGKVHEQAEDLATARQSYQTALDMVLDLDHSRLRAPLLADLGGLLVTQGSEAVAREHLDTALALAEELDLPGTKALALAHQARLPGGDAAAAAAALSACEPRLPRWDAMLTHFVLWETAGDRSQLAAAHGILAELIANAPEYRPGMLANVALHRRIDEAWRTSGEHPEAASPLASTESPRIA
jgi:tetratricopeptide (TPR) repeat protein